MDPLELVRSRNRADIELPSGLGATIGLVRIQDVVISGLIPVPILREFDKATGNGHPIETAKAALEEINDNPALIKAAQDTRREVVRRSLKRLAPSVAELEGPEVDMPTEVVAELSQEDFDVLAGYAMRDVPFPAASLST